MDKVKEKADSLPIPTWAWGAIGASVLVLVVVFTCCCCCCCKWKRKSKKDKTTKRLPKQQVDLKAFKREMLESTAQQVQPLPETFSTRKSRTFPRVTSSTSRYEFGRRGSALSCSPVDTSHRSLSKQLSLDIQMYSDDGSSVDGKASGVNESPVGKIRFSVDYDFTLRDLRVGVIECKDLAAKDFGGSSDPYVKVYVLPNKRLKHQTKVHKKTLNPHFNETFVFHDIEFKSIRDRSVYFEVIDFDQFSKHDMIGVFDLPLENVDLARTTEMWQDLKPPGKKLSSDLGEILFALCYLPTAGRLNVVIMKARNLKAMDITGKSDPYAKVSILIDGKRVKKKKTVVRKNTLSPVWNESFQFDLPTDKVNNAVAVISVIDYDALSRNDGIGQVEVGSACKALGGQHWRDMLSSPRRQIAQWHSLVAYTGFRQK